MLSEIIDWLSQICSMCSCAQYDSLSSTDLLPLVLLWPWEGRVREEAFINILFTDPRPHTTSNMKYKHCVNLGVSYRHTSFSAFYNFNIGTQHPSGVMKVLLHYSHSLYAGLLSCKLAIRRTCFVLNYNLKQGRRKLLTEVCDNEQHFQWLHKYTCAGKILFYISNIWIGDP